MEKITIQQPKKHSFGILLYRINNGQISIFLGETNNPRYWNRKNKTDNWGIPKGRPDAGETALHTALREFEEEVGNPAPALDYQHLMDYDTPLDKRITVFTADATGVDIAYGESMMHSVEWPAKSGVIVNYPEFSDARWFTKKEALEVTMWTQKGLVREFFKQQKAKQKLQLVKA